MSLRLDTLARRVDAAVRKLLVEAAGGAGELISYDRLIAGTGALPVRPAVSGMDQLGTGGGVRLLHPMGDTFEFVLAAGVVIAMGCGDACPLLPGKHHEDWELDDPAAKTLEEIRPIRDVTG